VVTLRPYDDTLLYCNSHIMSTPDAYGTVGGSPIGGYSNPSCRSCQWLMFHVATVTNHLRERGDGFRGLYLCEEFVHRLELELRASIKGGGARADGRAAPSPMTPPRRRVGRT
jgi:hypothetical protein